jgi:hypothetical protein
MDYSAFFQQVRRAMTHLGLAQPAQIAIFKIVATVVCEPTRSLQVSYTCLIARCPRQRERMSSRVTKRARPLKRQRVCSDGGDAADAGSPAVAVAVSACCDGA